MQLENDATGPRDNPHVDEPANAAPGDADRGHALPKAVLLVDDDPLMLDFLRIALVQAGWVTHAAETVADAKALFRDHPEITVIVSDILMPAESGFDLAGWLNATIRDESHAELILITGDATNDSLIAALRFHVFDFLKKPFQVRNLVSAAEKAHRGALARRERFARLQVLDQSLRRVQHERQQFQRRLQEAEARFVDTSARLTYVSQTMVNIVSHELRTPLIPIIGLAELLETAEEITPDETRTYAAEIRRAGENLAEIVENAMNFIDIERQMRAHGRDVVRLDRLFAEVSGELADLARQRGVRLVIEGDGEHRLRLPGALLRRALHVLLDNALRASPEQGVVTVQIAPSEAGELLICVTDAGAGLPERVRKNFGAPFVHGDASDTRTWPGIGLGIASALRIVEAAGGTLKPVALAPGTRMELRLPPGVRVTSGN
ncbi:MAG: response regulator [Pararhodobacter sp.]